jgi:2-polyprenyl-3-methyl-5-hydroxy-6-metoxy-1,4-benzoquinol methylase
VSGKRLLDVGSGRGLFLKTCLDRGAEVLGIDPDPANIRSCEAHGVRAVHGFFNIETNLGSFIPDLITIFEVIEHVYDPHPIISAAKKFNVPVYVSTPNAFNILRAVKFVSTQTHHDGHMDPVHNRDAQHIRAFSYRMVEELLVCNGFSSTRRITPIPLARYLEKVILVEARP